MCRPPRGEFRFSPLFLCLLAHLAHGCARRWLRMCRGDTEPLLMALFIHPTDVDLNSSCAPHTTESTGQTGPGMDSESPGAHSPVVVTEKKPVTSVRSPEDDPCVPDVILGTGNTETNRTAQSPCLMELTL